MPVTSCLNLFDLRLGLSAPSSSSKTCGRQAGRLGAGLLGL